LLARPFVHYVENKPQKARDHFYGLREAKQDLVGFALFDHLDQSLQDRPELKELMWQRREIENYICTVETLLAYAEASPQLAAQGPLFERAEAERRRSVMQECIEDFVPKAAQRNPADRWWVETKVSGEFLDRLFQAFFTKLGLPNLMNKTDYHRLARYIPRDQIDPEISTVLDFIVEVATKSRPIREEEEA
jgi:hypothetical protein